MKLKDKVILKLLYKLDENPNFFIRYPIQQYLKRIKKLDWIYLNEFEESQEPAEFFDLPKSIGALENLEYLDLSFNNILELPESIGKLKKLQTLYLKNNLLTSLPDTILGMESLSALDLSFNRLRTLPENIGVLYNLTELDISDNIYLAGLPKSIEKCRKLKLFRLAHCKKIRELCEFTTMRRVKTLDLCGCTLRSLPESLIDLVLCFRDRDYKWDGRDGIFIKDLTLTEQPKTMFLENDYKLIKRWYEFEGQTTKLDEAKVIFLGDSGVGKTYALKRLVLGGRKENMVNSNYYKPASDNLVIFDKKSVRLEDGSVTPIQYWDFKEEMIKRSLYRCFLTDFTCYVVVVGTETKRDVMTQARLWLFYLKRFTKDASVILLVNCKKDSDFELDKESLYKEFDILKQILVMDIKLSDKKEFLELKNSVLEEVVQLKRYEDKWLMHWNNVRRAIMKLIKEERKLYITQKEYDNICASNNIESDDKIKLQRKLNWLGTALSYEATPEMPNLSKFMSLNTEWLANALNLVIVSGNHHAVKGVLPHGGFAATLKDAKDNKHRNSPSMREVEYSADVCPFFWEIMEKYELSYDTVDGEFIPELAIEEKPKKLLPEEWEKSLKVLHTKRIYRYIYRPNTIIEQLMAYCKREEMPVHIWKNCMSVYYKEFDLLIWVDAGQNDRDIIFDVYTNSDLGKSNFGVQPLLMLYKHLHRINLSLRMQPEMIQEED